MRYSMEEVLPLVAELAEKYTGKESTSISYEKAEQLMEAVTYVLEHSCIRHCTKERQLKSREVLPAQEAYQLGYVNLMRKVKETQLAYNEMIVNFCAYGNENYQDTVTKAIPAFFRYYDVKFAPQETIITMDYPTIISVTDCCGIDAIAKYVEYISYEQKFLGALPQGYVEKILYDFQANYRKQFYNICSIVLRYILGRMLLKKYTEKELQKIVLEKGKVYTEEMLQELLKLFIENTYHADRKMEKYLQKDMADFATELYVSIKCGRNILIDNLCDI